MQKAPQKDSALCSGSYGESLDSWVFLKFYPPPGGVSPKKYFRVTYRDHAEFGCNPSSGLAPLGLWDKVKQVKHNSNLISLASSTLIFLFFSNSKTSNSSFKFFCLTTPWFQIIVHLAPGSWQWSTAGHYHQHHFWQQWRCSREKSIKHGHETYNGCSRPKLLCTLHVRLVSDNVHSQLNKGGVKRGA